MQESPLDRLLGGDEPRTAATSHPAATGPQNATNATCATAASAPRDARDARTEVIDTREIAAAPAEDDLSELLASTGRRRLAPVTAALLGGLVLVGTFTGGVLVQKHYGDDAAGAGPAGFAAGGAGGQGARSFGGFGQAPDGTGTRSGNGAGSGTEAGAAAPGAAADAADGAGSAGTGGPGTADASTPAVVGQVVSVQGDTLTVKNFAGKTVTVKVPEGTAVTSSSSVDLSQLVAGTSVSVAGTTADDGSVTASSVTSRPTG
ncbi:hypothetical protein [Motilibacter aurantiacus]|uniref:hypothetical protein n=1 Tax=Motilibacter aurantiacus TaxID=2714955 RepID=UPI00140A8453|nr:hypothetical protein [Motilibacter aurantiacus]NHC45113.1 hypothetical protein [Motilibacter aurantiacus]